MKPAPTVEIRPVEDFTALGALWRDLERRADGLFFQSWAWTGCLAEERFPDPWVLEARRDGRVLALGLFNRGPRRGLGGRPLLLGESGDPARDSIFIEHNGLLLDRAAPPALRAQCWAALDSAEGKSRWVLSGVSPSVADALPRDRKIRVAASRPAPHLDLARLPAGPVLDALSANTRQQLRRSLRAWEERGAIRIEIAVPDQADSFLTELAALHQRYWTGRGKPGAFAAPFFERFHRALLGRAGEGQSIDLIRVAAGERIIGYLYNFVHRGWVAAYQSGFDFSGDADRLRPGLVCHLQALEHYRRAGARLYDFLGGEARYKRSLANAETPLSWLVAAPRLTRRLGL